MRTTNAVALLAGITAAAAQVNLPSSIFGLPFGPQCQQAVLGVATNSSFAQCFPFSTLLPLLSTQESIIPILDQFMTELCYDAPCSEDALNEAAQQISTGCQEELSSGGFNESYVDEAFGLYPLVREVLCLKTEEPYTEESYGGALGPAPIPISDAYNQTDGTFCVSSVLTQLSAYYGTNITVPFITEAVSGANQTAQELTTAIEDNFLCNECIFGAVSVIEAAYPQVGDVNIASAASMVGLSFGDEGATTNSVLNDTCAYVPLVVDPTQLPPGITVSIVNSTLENSPASGQTDDAESTA